MKVQIIQKGNKYLIRKYTLGFIPMYWENGSYGGWGFSPDAFDDREYVERLVKRWETTAKLQREFDNSPEKIIKEVVI